MTERFPVREYRIRGVRGAGVRVVRTADMGRVSGFTGPCFDYTEADLAIDVAELVAKYGITEEAAMARLCKDD